MATTGRGYGYLHEIWASFRYFVWECLEMCIGYLWARYFEHPRYEPLPREGIDPVDNIGVWPRRLLYVPTMTSYEWQSGNRYGRHKSPKYNALSYTWGRYALRDGEKAHVQALRVNGITWNIPRIDPEPHFSAESFERVIRRAVKNHMYSGRWSAKQRSVKFLWLDVACIDQTFPRWASLEIGKQAAIFGRASTVYVWLSRHKTNDLHVYACDIFRASEEGPPSTNGLSRSTQRALQMSDCHWLQEVTISLQALLADPYFSSLWTLQEGYLSPAAILMSQDAEIVIHQGKRFTGAVTLYDLALAFRRLHMTCGKLLNLESGEHEAAQNPAQAIAESGLALYILAQPMVLYAVSRYRCTTYPEDRIYGIQQCFEFQLGRSNPDVDADRSYTVQELESEFGKKLLEMWPTMSQLFVHTVIPALGRGWHMNDESLVPSFGQSGRQVSSGFERACRLSTIDYDCKTWCYVLGISCTFMSMKAAWHELYGLKESYQHGNITFCHRIALDEELRRQLPNVGMNSAPGGRFQHDVADAIAHLELGGRLRVLLLDAIEPSSNWAHYYGLLVLLQEDRNTKYWHRLGICHWITVEEFDDNEVVPFLRGTGSDWVHIEGLYT